MTGKRFPYALLATGAVLMLLYPRVLPDDAPEALRGDLAVGLVYGVAIGLEVLALVLLRRRREGQSQA